MAERDPENPLTSLQVVACTDRIAPGPRAFVGTTRAR
jgi:hypothetical protein